MKKFILWMLMTGLVVSVISCGQNYYTIDDFPLVKKADTHIHINSENFSFAGQAEEDNFLLLNVNVDAPDNPSIEEQQRFAWHQIMKNPDQVRYLATFTLDDWDSSYWADSTIARLKLSFDKGALGVKLWKNIGMVKKNAQGDFVMIDDPGFDRVIQFIIDQDKTILGHLGEPKNCWLPLDQMTVNGDREYFRGHPEYHMFLHPEYPSYEAQVDARDRFLERHPSLRFVGAHLGSLEWNVDELAKRLDQFPNMAVDMAARITHLQFQTVANRERVRQFLIQYQDRLTYGSDLELSDAQNPEEARQNLHAVWLADWKYFATDEEMSSGDFESKFRGLKLPKAVVEKIFYHNAVRWFKIP